MRQLEHIAFAISEAERLGASMTIEHRAKHMVGIISFNGKQRKIFFSCSPRDNKVFMVVREDVKRKIREMQT